MPPLPQNNPDRDPPIHGVEVKVLHLPEMAPHFFPAAQQFAGCCPCNACGCNDLPYSFQLLCLTMALNEEKRGDADNSRDLPDLSSLSMVGGRTQVFPGKVSYP